MQFCVVLVVKKTPPSLPHRLNINFSPFIIIIAWTFSKLKLIVRKIKKKVFRSGWIKNNNNTNNQKLFAQTTHKRPIPKEKFSYSFISSKKIKIQNKQL